eukprot:1179986-Prorocentrum_minimum.AAC.4
MAVFVKDPVLLQEPSCNTNAAGRGAPFGNLSAIPSRQENRKLSSANDNRTQLLLAFRSPH